MPPATKLPTRIKGKAVDLRRPGLADAVTITPELQDRAIGRFTFIPTPYTMEHALVFLKATERAFRKRTDFVFAMESTATGQLVGMIGLHGFNKLHKRIEMGYWVAKSARGQGLCTEAVRLGLKFAFRSLGVNRVHAHVFPGNPASTRVLEKAGFTFEGTLRKYAWHRSRYLDCLLYSILKSEFRSRE